MHISAVCPDGIWTPMIADKLDDPDAAPSFSGHLLPATEVVAPRWRACSTDHAPCSRSRAGAACMVRLLDAFPGLFLRLVPLFMADARRRQRRWKKRIEAGKGP